MVCSPGHAYRCFMRTEMDYLVIGNYLLVKQDQPKFSGEGDWKREFKLDSKLIGSGPKMQVSSSSIY